MNSLLPDDIEFFLGDFLIALDDHLLALRIDDIVGRDSTQNIFPGDGHLLDLGRFHLAQDRPGEFLAFLDDDVVGFRVAHVGAHFGT